MDRTAMHKFRCHWAILTVLLTLPMTAGCNVFATTLYVLNGHNQPAAFDQLDGKKIVVICRPSTSVQYSDASVAKELSQQIGLLIKDKVKRIKVVKQKEVDEWADVNNLDSFDYVQIGKALHADMVVGVDLERFSLSIDQTLYQGKANMRLGVYDVRKGDKEPVFERHLPQVTYPPTTPIAASDMPESQFRRKFVAVLADIIGRHFYEHDPTADFANDSTAYN